MIIHDHLVQQTLMNRSLYLVEKGQFFWTQAPRGTGQGVIIIIITIHIRIEGEVEKGATIIIILIK